MSKKIQKNNYQIIRIERQLVTSGWFFKKTHVIKNKIVMMRFFAKDDNDARKYLNEYKKAANKQYIYFFERYQPLRILHDNGTTSEYESFEQIEEKRNFIKKILDYITTETHYLFIDRPLSIKYWISNLIYMLKYKHAMSESWSIDNHIIDDIIWNVPILLKNKCGIATVFLDKAIIESHKNETCFDIRKWNKNHHEYSKEEEQTALKYQKEEYAKILKYAKLYKYYLNFGIIDENNINEVEFDSKWHHTLPIIIGTYDSIDYAKLNVLTNKYWNKIWDWMKLYGQTLWD